MLPFSAYRLAVSITSADSDAVLSLNGTSAVGSLSTELHLEIGQTWLQLTVTSDSDVAYHTYVVERNGESSQSTVSSSVQCGNKKEHANAFGCL